MSPAPAYASRTRRPPRCPLDRELARVLKVSGQHRDGFRDHCIIALAAGTGLRESEITGLDTGVLLSPDGNVRRVLRLAVYKRGGGKADPDAQRIALPESVYYKLDKYARAEQLATLYPDSPVFWSKKGNRLSTRAVRALWQRWQGEAGIDRPYNFHALRHYACTLVQRTTKDIRITQAFARHARAGTTSIYLHVSDDELAAAVRELPL